MAIRIAFCYIYWAVLVLLVYVSEAEMTVSKDIVSRNVAFENCNGNLGTFANISELDKMTNDLTDGQSAWVSGRVRYSHYLTLLGCYNRTYRLGVLPAILEGSHDAFLYKCATECVNQNDQNLYIATYSGVCYCLTSGDRQRLKNPTNCEIEPNKLTQPDYRHTGDNYMLYSMDHYVHEPMEKQCMTVKYTANQSYPQSRSCYESAGSIDGYICTCLVDECDSYGHAHVSSLTRASAFRMCVNNSEVLTDSLTHISLQGLEDIEVDKEYWTGMFRAFTVLQDIDGGDEGDSNICLAVTKVNGFAVLDPDVCTAKKSYLCSQNYHKTRNLTPPAPPNPMMETSTEDYNSTPTYTQTENDVTPTKNNDNPVTQTPIQDHNSPFFKYELYFLFLCLIPLTIGVIMIIIIRRKKRNKKCQTNDGRVQADKCVAQASYDEEIPVPYTDELAAQASQYDYVRHADIRVSPVSSFGKQPTGDTANIYSEPLASGNQHQKMQLQDRSTDIKRPSHMYVNGIPEGTVVCI